MKKGITYAESGVNIHLGDDVSKILYYSAKQTWVNRKGKLGEVILPFDDFSGVRAINVSGLPKGSLMSVGFDGIGTKVEFAERAENYLSMAYDLFAMVCDDAVVRGAEPVLVGSILDVNSLCNSKESFKKEVMQLATGYVDAARVANVAVVNGEVAELGNRVGGYGNFNFNWGAGVVWFAKKDRMFTGREIKAGDFLVGFEEKGFRSNGLTLVRKILENNYGKNWHYFKWKDNSRLGNSILVPSRIYSKAVVDMFGGFEGIPKTELHGVAHITGGGLPGKLERILRPSGLGAFIDNPFEPSEIMKYVQELGNISDKEAYKTWNMGQGMVVISPKPYEVIDIAKSHGIKARLIGHVSMDKGVKIRNKGVFNGDSPACEGGFLSF